MATSSNRRWADLARVLPPRSRVQGTPPPSVAGLSDDSRNLRAGEIFFAVGGGRFDGRRFVEQAVARGAAAVVAEGPVDRACPVPWVAVPDVRDAMARMAGAWWRDELEGMTLLGVTGTNGKTSTVWFLREVLRHLGEPVASIGTLGVFLPDGSHRRLANTTPGCLELHRLLAEARGLGARWAVMEVSSQAAVQRRVEGLPFAGAAFTNLTPEHFELHGDLHAYRAAKLLWFRQVAAAAPAGGAVAVVNVDDPSGGAFLAAGPSRTLSFSPGGNEADLRGIGARDGLDGVGFTLCWQGQDHPCRLSMPGLFNVENALAAAGLLLGQGLEPERVVAGLEAARTVPGRVSPVPGPRRVLIDYAHSSDAMEKLLGTLRPLVERGRLVVVFGCGGDRDPSKRARMGASVARFAHRAIVTNDNPRSEDPGRIAAMILEGVPSEARQRFEVELDRRRAIERAVTEAGEEDLVVVAGKGHEDYQIFGAERTRFDDREEAARVQRRLEEERVVATAPPSCFDLDWMASVLAVAPRNRRGDGVTGFAIDSRRVAPGEVFVAIRGERFDGARFAAAAVERGAAAILARTDEGELASLPNLFVVPDEVEALTRLARAHRDRHAATLVAVTGTNGKTTTKDVLSQMLAARRRVVATAGNFNNHIGLPLSLLRLRPEHEVGIFELGMSSRGEISHLARIVRPHVGVITNVGPAHLEFLGTVAQVAEAKAELLEGLSTRSLLVLNASCRWARTIARRHGGPVLWAGLGRRGDARLDRIRVLPDRLGGRLRLGDDDPLDVVLPVAGRHMAFPFLMAALVARHLGFDREALEDGFARIRATGGRMRVVLREGVHHVDDTYNANPASMGAALDFLRDVEATGRRFAVLGDMLEMGKGSLAAHRRIARRCDEAEWMEACWLVGDEFGKISLPESRSGRVRACVPRPRIAADLRRSLRAGDVVLFKGSRGVRVEEILRAVLGDDLD